MSTLTVRRLIDAPPQQVWAQLADVTLVPSWHPGVEKADLLSEKPTGLGATRRCHFYDQGTVVEEVVESEVDKKLTLDIREFPGPMQRFQVAWELLETPKGKTQLNIHADYKMKFGILGELMSALVVKRRMAERLNRVLVGLEHHVKTGEFVTQNFS